MDDEGLTRVLQDRGLAALGDALVNLIYSLALTKHAGRPVGSKVANKVLSDAVKLAGLRPLLPRRIDRHVIGDAAEALIAYAWLEKLVSLDECVEALAERLTEPVDAFVQLLTMTAGRVKASR